VNPTKHASSESLKVCTPEDNTRQDRYIHFRFNGEEFPLAREEAWRIQAEGYRSMGFVTGKAIDERGFLYPEIDKSRGIPGSEYYIVISDAEEDDRATLRKVPPRPFCDYTSLPAYESTKDTLYPLGKKLLENMEKIRQNPSIRNLKDSQQSRWSIELGDQLIKSNNDCLNHEKHMNIFFREFYEKYLKIN
jgi:hypothetical protein